MNIITNIKYQCDICHEDYDFDHFNICHDKQTCYECLSHYIKNEINAGVDVITCPYPDHKDIKCGYNDEQIGLIMNNDIDTLRKLHKNQIKKTFKDNEHITYCPKCEFANIYINTNNISCLSCSHNYVISIKKQTMTEVVDVQSEEWKKQHTKKCPQCGYHIQKIDGCSHVHCTKCDGDFDYDTLKIMNIGTRNSINPNELIKHVFSVENNRLMLQNYRYLLCFMIINKSKLSKYKMFDTELFINESNLKKIDYILKKFHPLNSQFESIIKYFDNSNNLNEYIIDLIIKYPFLIGYIDIHLDTYSINSVVNKLSEHGELLSKLVNDKTVMSYFIDQIIKNINFGSFIKNQHIFDGLRTSRIFRNTVSDNQYFHYNNYDKKVHNLYNSTVLFHEIMNRSVYTIYVLTEVSEKKNVAYLESIYLNNKQEFIGFLNFCDFVNTIGDELIDVMSQQTSTNLFINENIRKELARIGNDDNMTFDVKFETVKKYAYSRNIYNNSNVPQLGYDSDDYVTDIHGNRYHTNRLVTLDDYRRQNRQNTAPVPTSYPHLWQAVQPVQPALTMQPARPAQPAQPALSMQPAQPIHYMQPSQSFRMPSVMPNVQQMPLNQPQQYMFNQPYYRN